MNYHWAQIIQLGGQSLPELRYGVSMAGSSLPGPICVLRTPLFDRGTLTLGQSPIPGPIGGLTTLAVLPSARRFMTFDELFDYASENLKYEALIKVVSVLILR